MSKQLKIQNGNNKFATYAIDPSDTIYAVVLSSNVEKSINIPLNSRFCLFGYNAPCFVKIDGTAVIPSNDILDGSGPELNPQIRYLIDKSKISLISAVNCTVTIAFYQ